MNKLLIIIISFILGFYSHIFLENKIVEPNHIHDFRIVSCGDGLQRIMCVNHNPSCYTPATMVCLDEGFRSLIVVDNPSQQWEINLSQANEICKNFESWLCFSSVRDSDGYAYNNVYIFKSYLKRLKETF